MCTKIMWLKTNIALVLLSSINHGNDRIAKTRKRNDLCKLWGFF